MSKQNSTVSNSVGGAFRFWNKKDKESKELSESKKGGLSKEYLWKYGPIIIRIWS